MKKIIMIAIALILTLFFVGCNGNGAVTIDSDYDSDFDNGTVSEAFENDRHPTEKDTPTLDLDSNDGFGLYYEEDFCEGDFDIRKFRPIFYDMPVSFVELVGREVFRNWLMSRSDEESENENVAVSFIKYFNINREDFIRANEELRQLWADLRFIPAGSELYPVDLIFTFDNDRINRYFLWENSLNPQEREFGRGEKM